MAKDIGSKLLAKGKWGRLTPVGWVRDDYTSSGSKKPVWAFWCDCGATAEIRAYSVSSGKTQSCGCLLPNVTRGVHQTHGASSGALTPEYRSWRNMLTRARNPRISHADRYSGRGIDVSAEWLPGGDGKGFERFFAHIGPRPEGTSLDRIDNDRGYQPGNVRWATAREQIMNRRNTVMIADESGRSVPLADYCGRRGIKPSVVRDRIRRGWPESRLFEPTRAINRGGNYPFSAGEP